MSLSNKPVYEISSSTLHGLNFIEIWQYRHLAVLLAWRHIRARYKQTVLGLLWAVIVPVAFTVIFVIFFRLVRADPSAGVPYIPSAFAGMIMWQLFTRGVSEGATSLTANANLITKVYFPRIVLPLAAVLSAIFDIIVSFILLAGVLIWFEVPWQPQMLLAPIFVLQVAFIVMAFSLWLSAFDGLFRDLRHALPLILQLGMFVSPVAYTTSAFVPQAWISLYELNPLVGPIEGLRWALLPGAAKISASAEFKSLFITALLFFSGLLFFARMERTIVDRV